MSVPDCPCCKCYIELQGQLQITRRCYRQVEYQGQLVDQGCCVPAGEEYGYCKHPFKNGCCYETAIAPDGTPYQVPIGPAADLDDDCLRIDQSYVFGICPCSEEEAP
jgi:hypothetical protein